MLKFVVAETTKRTEFVVVVIDKREVLNEDEEGVPKAGMEVVGVANGFRLEVAGVADGIRLGVCRVASSSNSLAGKKSPILIYTITDEIPGLRFKRKVSNQPSQQLRDPLQYPVVVCILETMLRAGQHTSGRPSASTQVQELDHSQAQDPGADQETLQEQPLQYTPVMERTVNTRDVRTLIELNQYKYINVPVAEEQMANLTSNELAEAIRLYRQEKTWLQEEAKLEEEPEESGDSQQSKRSVFDRIGAKGKKNKKDQGNKKET
ncbi:hypothetical protein AgCh_002487 [Apium graveolens]